MYPYKIFGNFDLYMLCIVLGAAAWCCTGSSQTACATRRAWSI